MLQIYELANPFIGNRVYAGINTEKFNGVYAKQETSKACWAACLQGIAKYYAISVRQEDFMLAHCGVDSCGNPKDCAAPVDIITKYSNICVRTHCIKTKYVAGPPDINTLFNLLQNNQPVILGYNYGGPIGHAVILTGVSIDQTIYGNFLHSVIVRDPSPDILNQLNYGRKEYVGNGKEFLEMVYGWWIPTVWKY